jgi:hypothetical protein
MRAVGPWLPVEVTQRRASRQAVHGAVFGPNANPGCCKGLCGRGLWRDLEAPSSAGFMAARAARFVN